MSKNSWMTDHHHERSMFLSRMISISILVLILATILIIRLFILQVSHHHYYVTLSEQNQLNILPLRPNRGLIYDRNGILIAENLPIFSLEITPEHVKGFKKTIASIKKLINISDEDMVAFKKQMRIRRRYEPVPLKMRLSDDEVALFSVNNYHYPGVRVRARMMRYYPYGKSLAHVLGYVGRINEREIDKLNHNYSATNYIGKVGLEKYYENILHGQVGYETVETDARGRVLRTVKRVPPKAGYNLYLALDLHLQFAAEQALGDQKGAVVAINPNNGEILAMVSKPSYDPNVFVHGISVKDYKALRTDPKQPLYNRAVRGQYPLASTIKPFVALGALDKNIVSEKFRISDKGWFSLPGSSHVYRDWKKTGHGRVNARRAIIVSCDTYFYTVAVKMGITRLSSWLRQFGFGNKTLVDMNEEIAGVMPDPSWKRRRYGQKWYQGDTVSAGIGQGYMLTTPLQLANASATLAAIGHRYRPHLLMVKQRIGEEKIPYKVIEEHPVDVNNKKYWALVRNAMRSVITSGEGTGYRFGRDAKYAVAAKTGTAQVFSAKRHPHLDRHNLPELLRDHSLFIAFAPLNNPQIAVGVVVENSKRASNVARAVLDFYFGEEAKQQSGIIDYHRDEYVG